MPKLTFDNLPKEKKEKLVEAAFNEFSRVPYEEVSINQIIKDAEISRGSFYMYFENKLDLLIYLLKDFLSDMIIECFIDFKKCNYDPFILFESLFDYVDKNCAENTNKSFFEHLFSRLRIEHNEDFMKQIYKDTSEMMGKSDILMMMKNGIYGKCDEELISNVLDILFMITQHRVVNLMIKGEDSTLSKKKLLAEFELVKNGLLYSIR